MMTALLIIPLPVLSSHHLLFRFFCSVSIAATEKKGIIFIPFRCIYQCLCNAVRNSPDVAVFQTLEAAFDSRADSSLICCKNGFKIARPGIPTGLWVMMISSFCVDISLLVNIRSITFFGSNETGAYLHSFCPQFKLMHYIFMGINAPGSYYRDMLLVLFLRKSLLLP